MAKKPAKTRRSPAKSKPSAGKGKVAMMRRPPIKPKPPTKKGEMAKTTGKKAKA